MVYKYMKEIGVEAKTFEEAVAIALKKLGAKRKEAEVTILDEGNKGLFGMEGSKKAKVRVRMKEGE